MKFKTLNPIQAIYGAYRGNRTRVKNLLLKCLLLYGALD